jgi:hypothetical protein
MPYPTEHAARIRQPGEFEQGSFRRSNNKFGPGVHAIFGKLKGKSAMEVQAIRFSKAKWTPERAKEWLDKNGYKPISFEPASSGDATKKKMGELEEVFSFREVPAEALTFEACSFEVGNNGDGSKTAPLRIMARGGAPIDHGFWGKVAHDMSGMRLKGGRVPVDYNHNPNEVIGYLNHFDISDGNLRCSGALVPYKDQDRATEVAFKANAGVPYEASIFFGGGDVVIEELCEGDVAEVNGAKMSGPGVIFREWPLRGVAVCPYGADQNTSAEMSEKTFTVRTCGPIVDDDFQDKDKENEMSQEQEAEAARVAAVEAASKAEAEAAAKLAADAAAVEAERAKKPGLRFIEAFGREQGGAWFAEGVDFEEAQKLFNADLKAKYEIAVKENAELKARLQAVSIAGATPAASSAPAPEVTPEKSFVQLVEEKIASAKAAGTVISRTQAIREVAVSNPGAYEKNRSGK